MIPKEALERHRQKMAAMTQEDLKNEVVRLRKELDEYRDKHKGEDLWDCYISVRKGCDP